MGNSPGNIFDQLAAHDTQKIGHDQSIQQTNQPNIFDKLAGQTAVPGAPNGLAGLPGVQTPAQAVNMQPNYATQQLLGSDPNMQLRSMQPGLPAAGQDPQVAAAGQFFSGIALGLGGAGEAASALTAPRTARILEEGSGDALRYVIEAGPSRLKAAAQAISEAQQAHPWVDKLIKIGAAYVGLKHLGTLQKLAGGQ